MQDLIGSMKSGDSKAFETCFNRYRPYLFWTIYKMIKNKADAEDLTMITFEKAFERIHFYNPTYKFSSWLYKIATNTVLDHIKMNSRRAQRTDDLSTVQITDFNNPEWELINSDHFIYLLNGLSTPFKQIISLFVDGYMYKEISGKLNLPMGTVTNYIFRARNQLKKAI